MATSKRTRFSGVKVYRRYCFGAILSGLCALAVAAVYGAFVIFPVFSFIKDGSSEVAYKGLDLVFFGIRRFYSRLYTGNFDDFLAYFSSYAGDNSLLTIICQIHEYIEIAIIALLALSVLFAAIGAFLGLIFIIVGRIHHPKATYTLAKVALIFYILFAGIFYLYLFFFQEVVKGGAGDATIKFSLYPAIFAGAMLVLVIILGITHSVQFKDRVYASRKKGGANNKKEIEEQPVQEMQPVVQTQQIVEEPQKVVAEPPKAEITEVPPDIKEIGDHAFSKNTSLKTANIPNGITTIGDGAFSNCLKLETVTIPLSVKYIGYNAFFNTPSLQKITYLGSKEDWKAINKGSNWLTRSNAKAIFTTDGSISPDY